MSTINPHHTLLVVAAGLINQKGHVLIAQRPQNKNMSGFWEFPGGKVEPHETPEFALARELFEELGLIIDPADFTPFSFLSQPHGQRHLLMPFYLCHHWSGDPQSLEHQNFAWVQIDQLLTYKILPGNIALVKALENHLTLV